MALVSALRWLIADGTRQPLNSLRIRLSGRLMPGARALSARRKHSRFITELEPVLRADSAHGLPRCYWAQQSLSSHSRAVSACPPICHPSPRSLRRQTRVTVGEPEIVIGTANRVGVAVHIDSHVWIQFECSCGLIKHRRVGGTYIVLVEGKMNTTQD